MATKKFKALPKKAQRAAFAEMDDSGTRKVKKSGTNKKYNPYEKSTVESLVALKKKKYANVDISSAMSKDEKMLTKTIAKKFSADNEERRKRHEAARAERQKEKLDAIIAKSFGQKGKK